MRLARKVPVTRCCLCVPSYGTASARHFCYHKRLAVLLVTAQCAEHTCAQHTWHSTLG
ncbi:unnamed protein product [Chondrus crispus]|uniref:Uncharacterized protein n=1 Tax=Chondrus crispus TaxID=2769 RepID=R7QAG1_CHOCR|nr:unnamed protein product [Chondrus crispus]CDF34450.1 unnamed protein product [Chondrus crispus]|eukprot:XP_005714269.1 unnamed protein product [Chondrus crispus]